MSLKGANWSRRSWVALGVVALVGLALRLLYIGDPGYADDLGDFATLTANIERVGLGRAYDGVMSFGPVVAYTWWLLTLVNPTAFHAAVNSSDPAVTVLLKVPPVLADFGLAALVLYALRARPTWAVVAAAIVLLHPVTWFVSAWWGQYESVYVLFALLAFVLAVRDHPLLGAIALTAAVLAKPQALPFVLPFAAWYLARYDRRTLLRSGLSAVVTAIVLWLPFLPWDGPGRYLTELAYYYNVRFDVLSLRAWNMWWIVEHNILHIRFQDDRAVALGPLTYRMIGFAITGLLSGLVAYRIWRRPTPAVFAAGLAASVLIAFAFLTSMHDRYAYAAVIFLALLPDRRSALLFSIPVGALIMWNLLASASASGLLHWQWNSVGTAPLVGSIGMCVCALLAIAVVWGIGPNDDSALDATTSADLEAADSGARDPARLASAT